MPNCFIELIAEDEDGVPVKHPPPFRMPVDVPEDARGTEILSFLLTFAGWALADFDLDRSRVQIFYAQYNAFGDTRDGINFLQLEDHERYQFNLVLRQGRPSDQVVPDQEFYDVPRQAHPRDVDEASSASDFSYLKEQWEKMSSANPNQHTQNASTPPHGLNQPIHKHASPPHQDQSSSQVNKSHSLRKGSETASNETLVSGHHSIKSGMDNLNLSDSSQQSPGTTYYDMVSRSKSLRRSEPRTHAELRDINRCALGTDAHIGDLADCIREQIHDVNMFGDNLKQLPLSAIPISSLDDQRTPIFEADNFKEQIKFLHVDEEQTISIISQSNHLAGHGLFLNEEHKSEREISMSLVYIEKTEKHVLNLAQVYDLVATNIVLNTSNVTHFISGIEFGFILAVKVRAMMTRDSDEQSIIDEMKDYLQAVKKLLDGDDDVEDNNKFCCTIYCDEEYKVKKPCGPWSASQLASIIQDMLSAAAGLSPRGTQLSYQLTPVYALRSYIPHLNLLPVNLNPFPKSQYKELLKKHISLQKLLAKKHDLESDVKEFASLQNESSLKAVETTLAEISREHNAIKRAVSNFVVSHRTQREGDYTWRDVVEKYDKLLRLIDTFVAGMKPFCAKVQHVYRWQKHANFKYVGKNDKCEEVIQMLQPECYVLFCNWQEADATADGELAKFDLLLADNKHGAFVDQDVTAGQFPGQSRICLYKNGVLADEDLLCRYVEKFVVCISKSTENKVGTDQIPDDAVQLEIACPKSLRQHGCKHVAHFWYCKACYECYYYYNEFFYCRCGRASAFTFEFRCNDPAHGSEFHKYDRGVLDDIIKKIPPMVDLNILVLGMSGVGKSTWLNGLANYLSFSTLEQARLSPKPVVLIPSAFTLKAQRIRVGEDSNLAKYENLNVGDSATTTALGHVFVTRNLRLRFIDTPGICDTAGAKQDDANMGSTLAYLARYKELHAICILLKPNDARSNVIFRYGINALLANLHKDAARNLVFCFTNAKATYFKKAEAHDMLVDHLKLIKDVKIELKDGNIYHMDNESVRYLYGRREGVHFDDDEIESIKKSWNFSQKEIARLVNYIRTLEPHKMDDTISLNRARHLILLLARPLADITRNIQRNIQALHEKRDELALLEGNEQDLRSRCMIPQFEIEAVPLGHPRTVCTAPTCVQTRTVGNANVAQTLFIRHCHPHCHLTGVVPDRFPDPNLRNCSAMNNGVCRECGCCYDVHMHITYDQKLVCNNINDPSVEAIFAQKNNDKAGIEQAIHVIEETLKEFKREQKVITDTSCKFGAFLKKHAIMPYNDSFEDYINYNINEETQMLDEDRLPKEVKKSRRAKIAALQQTLAEYKEQKRIIVESKDNFISTLTPGDIEKDTQKLFDLKLTGKTIKTIFDQSAENVSNLRDSENKFKPTQQDIEQFNTALQSKDSVYAQLSPAPEKLPKDISVEPVKKREAGTGWVSFVVDKFYWLVGSKREAKDIDTTSNDGDEDNTYEHVANPEDNSNQYGYNSPTFDQQNVPPPQGPFPPPWYYGMPQPPQGYQPPPNAWYYPPYGQYFPPAHDPNYTHRQHQPQAPPTSSKQNERHKKH